MAGKPATLTDRDRYWLRQQGSWEKSGLSTKEYARKHKLSIHGFYQARKRLRAIGALDAASPRSAKAKSRASGAFTRVELPATMRGPRYRVRLPNGALVEWEGASGADLAEVLGVVSQLG
jgi:hypothetical protein